MRPTGVGKIVVFDSGLGSLSVVRPILRATRSDLVYFADQRHFPYGAMPAARLRKIITERIGMLEEKFEPDMIVVGSNTPTLLLGRLPGKRTVGVLPPIKAALNATKTGRVAILATRSASRSTRLLQYIRGFEPAKKGAKVIRIDCSVLVDMVESGQFMTNSTKCSRLIRGTLGGVFEKNRVDSATLSSTHLPFLLPALCKEFPGVKFFDPAHELAQTVKKSVPPSPRNRLSVYTSGDPAALHEKLVRLGVRNRVLFLA